MTSSYHCSHRKLMLTYMYKISSEFGFKYDSMPWNVTSSTPMPPNCNLPPATECDKGGYYPTVPPLPDHCPPGDFVCPRNSTTMVKLPWCGGQKHLLPYCNKRRRWVAWCRNRQHLPWCQSSWSLSAPVQIETIYRHLYFFAVIAETILTFGYSAYINTQVACLCV